MKVFIVEDSALVCERLADMLRDLPGVEIVGQRKSPTGAISALEGLDSDVVILDIRLVGGSGIDVLKAIRRKGSAPVVIVLTNYPYPQYRKKCMDAGADFFFDKSTDFEKIPGVIEQLMVDVRIQ